MRLRGFRLFARRARHALRHDRGSATVEFAMWMPMFGFVIAAVADASFLLYSQTRLLDVARDTSRQVSLGLISANEVDAMIAARMGWAAGYQSQVVEVGDFITTRLSVPFSAVTVFGEAVFQGQALSAEYTMLREAPVAASTGG